MHITMLTNERASVRERILMAEGLLAHEDIKSSFNREETVMGRAITRAEKDIYAALEGCDFIFQFEDEHFFDHGIKDFIQKRDLYHKLIYLDFKDDPKIERDKLIRSYKYFKRSWSQNCTNVVQPITYGVLKAYLDPRFHSTHDKYDISYMFPPGVGGKRGKVRNLIKSFDFGNLRINLGTTTSNGDVGRKSITRGGGPWASYYETLNSSKIVFTVLPDWDGDSRTWEALSCQAMAFIDRPTLPLDDKVEHMRHAYLFDASDEKSTINALKAAVDLLKNDEVRLRITKQGIDHVTKHHMGINRVSYILGI